MSENLIHENKELLKQVAVCLLWQAEIAFASEHPEQCAALRAACVAGEADVGVTIRLTPRAVVEVWAQGLDGKQQVILTVADPASAAN